jgi:dCTP deaminase
VILSDRDINRRCSDDKDTSLIWPYKREDVQPASVDLTLDDVFLIPHATYGMIDLADVSKAPGYTRLQRDYFVLGSQQFVLGSTTERVNTPPDCVGSIEGKSSLARLGLFVHVTAGFLDPGFQGKVTLELLNVNPRPIKLRAGLHICQVAFHRLNSVPENLYGSKALKSKYQGQTETTASKYQG